MKVYEHEHEGRKFTADVDDSVGLAVDAVVTVTCDAPGERAVSHAFTIAEFNEMISSVHGGLGRLDDEPFADAPPNAGDGPVPE